MTDQTVKFETVDKVNEGFKRTGYICRTDRNDGLPGISPGEAGPRRGAGRSGQTELAKKAAQFMDVPLIRLQCSEGLDESKALDEWKTASSSFSSSCCGKT